ncbi:phosphatidylserine decarboxylase [Candidatus Dependentiae bacterium]|nr:phosphatidylserine decarboxylase [Candidatus Dependentiae bacterium]MBU4386856.1 phosphatidylserine decarboxylase [Candidatus Dependentiae bacterium]MCG2756364.1 archaetidylserine decarboxylase [Candidatus Dependentiae bacterium]
MKILNIFFLLLIIFIILILNFWQTKNSFQKIYYYDVNNKLVIEKTEALSFLNFLYFNKLGQTLRPIFIQKFLSKLIGFYQDSFFSKYKIKYFIKKHNINMSEFIKTESEYKSFNDFFVRELKQDIRNINKDITKVIAPADSKLFVIDNLSRDTEFFVKNIKFNLNNFLNDFELANRYQDGLMLIFRLSPQDYHRYHFPFDCVVSKEKTISGKLESVNSLVYKSGIQPLYTNERISIKLGSKNFGDVLFIPVGAMFVGKIVNKYFLNKEYKKGELIGYFEFGGSTIVLIFEKNKIKIKERFLINSQNGYETQVKMGDVITD